MAFLLYLAASGALALLAKRLFGPLPIRTLLVLALAPLVLTGPALVTSEVLAPTDRVFAHYPFKAFAGELGADPSAGGAHTDLIAQLIPWKVAAREAWRSGDLPLWNPYMLAGDVLAPSAQSAPYEPKFLLSVLLPLGPSLDFLATITLFMAGLGMFLFLRDLELGEIPSLFGSLVWMFGGFVVFWLEWAITPSAIWLPFVLLGVSMIVRDPGWRPALILTGMFAWMLLSGHHETGIHIVYVGVIWALREMIRQKPPPRSLAQIAAAGTLAGIAAVFLTAFFLAPIIEALPETVEYHSRKYIYAHQDRTQSSEVIAARLASPIIPWGWGYAGLEHVPEAPEFPLPDAPYPGSIALLLALVGLVGSRRSVRWLFAILGAGAMIVAAELPVLGNLTAKLPGLGMSLNDRFDFVTLFCLAALAALGVESWLSGSGPTKPKWVLVMGFGLAILAISTVPIVLERGLSLEFVLRLTGGFAVPLIVGTLVLTLARSKRFAGSLVLFALLLIQRVFEVGWIYPTVEAEQFYPEIPILEAIPEHDEPFRIVGLGDVLTPATSAIYRLEDVRGYQALSFLPMRLTFEHWAVHQPVWFNRVDDLTRPFLGALNVRYALGPPGYEIPSGWRLFMQDESGTLMERDQFIRRAFVPEIVRINDFPEVRVEGMRNEENFEVRSWVDHPASGAPPDEIVNGRGEVLGIVATSMRSRALRVRMDSRGWVVVSEPYWKGWKAYEDGRRIPLRRSNGALFALHLEPGTHEVELIYAPRSFLVGSWISLLTLCTILAIGAGRARHRRNH